MFIFKVLNNYCYLKQQNLSVYKAEFDSYLHVHSSKYDYFQCILEESHICTGENCLVYIDEN